MSEFRIYLSPPYIPADLTTSIGEGLASGWLAPAGPILTSFETKLATTFSWNNVLVLQSATAALHLAVRLAGVTAGDRVVVGTLTFVAAANVVRYVGAEPVFMDVDHQSWGLDPNLLDNFLAKAHPKPKAVIVTHLYGRMAAVAQLKQLCEQHGVVLIEDAAEAQGSSADGVAAGGWGQFGAVSFNGNKLLTTGGGGVLITQAAEDRERALFWATQAKDPAGYYLHSELGYNYRMGSLQASVGLAQLGHFSFLLESKRKIYTRYQQLLERCKALDWPTEAPNEAWNHWLSVVLIRRDFLRQATPDHVIAALADRGIEARRFWNPLHRQPLYAQCDWVGHGIADDLFTRGICLPSGVGLTEADQREVAEVVAGCFIC